MWLSHSAFGVYEKAEKIMCPALGYSLEVGFSGAIPTELCLSLFHSGSDTYRVRNKFHFDPNDGYFYKKY